MIMKVRNIPTKNTPTAEFWLEERDDGRIVLKGHRTDDPLGDGWTILSISKDGLKLHTSIVDELGFPKDDKMRIKVRP